MPLSDWNRFRVVCLQIKALDSMRAVVDEIRAPLGPNTFPFDSEFLDIEQYKSIGKEALMNIGLGFAMIAVVVLVLVSHPVAAVLTFVNVASAILELVGFMYLRGTYIDSVSVIFLVISLGLAVDYSVHVANGYLATRVDDPTERIVSTMAVRCSLFPFCICCVCLSVVVVVVDCLTACGSLLCCYLCCGFSSCFWSGASIFFCNYCSTIVLFFRFWS